MYLRKILYHLITEGLSEERALDKLANDILIHVSESLLENKNYGIWKKEDDDYYRIYNNVFEIKPDTLNIENYPDTIKKFIESNGIRILFTTKTKDEGTRGYYVAPNNIFLAYLDDDFKEIWQMLNGKYITFGNQVLTKVERNDIYSKLFYKFESTLLHELKHAYDDFISKGNLTNSKRWRRHIDILNSIPQDIEKQTFSDQSRKSASYLRLPHEISARFSQALSKVHFDKFADDSWTVSVKKDFKEVFKDFRYRFENWNVLTDNMKRLLIKRLYKYWDEYQVKNDN